MSSNAGYTYRMRRVFLRLGLVLSLVVSVSACDVLLPQSDLTSADIEATSQFVSIPLNQTWTYTPGALTAMQRGLVNSSEQRIALPNKTTVPGDNSLLLRASFVEGPAVNQFSYEAFLRRSGGLPGPFGAMKSGDLLSNDDELGTYFWAESRLGENTVCVLALRRLNSGMRQMPGNTNILEVLLRNCVNGTVEDALKPITATNIGNYPGAAAVAASGPVRMLSPLAGPTP